MARVLYVTTEALPDCGKPVGGGGLRSWCNGEALRARGHEVEYAFPLSVASRFDFPPERRRLLFTRSNLTSVVAAAQPDVAVFQQWYPLSYVADPPCPIAVDIPGPLMLEGLWRGGQPFHVAAIRKIRALAKADFFMYATDLQWAYWLPWLLMAGVPHENPPMACVPISMPPPQPIHPDRTGQTLRFVYAGIFWAWADPSPAMDALCRVMPRFDGSRLAIIGGHHPQHDSAGERYRDEIRGYAAHPQVELRDVIPHEELIREYAGCDVGLNLEIPNIERKLSSTVRAVVQLWAGIPILIGENCWLAELVRQYDAGWVVNPEDSEGLDAVFESLLQNPEAVRARSANAQRLAAEHFNAHETIEPLHRFCLDPVVRERRDRVFGPIDEDFRKLMRTQRKFIRQRAELPALKNENHALRTDLHALQVAWRDAIRRAELAEKGLENIQNKGLFRAYKAIARLLGRGKE